MGCYKNLQFDIEIDTNEYKIMKPSSDEFIKLVSEAKEDTTYYVNDLDITYIYIIKKLLTIGFCQNTKGKKTFNFVCKKGVVPNIKIINNKNIKVNFVNFDKKFGICWHDLTAQERDELVQYSIEKGRLALSIGADAYAEFVETQLPKTRYKSQFLRAKIMRKDNHYPIFVYDRWLLEAKNNVSGYQYCIPGRYSNLYDIDQNASYPSQLLGDMPCGLPKYYTNLEAVPISYYKIITFTYFNCKIKKNGIEFLVASSMGMLTLPEKLFELFLENYDAVIKIRRVMAFKTQKSPFRKFINQTLIDGKIKETRPHIAKYNKAVGNSLVGYFGRNELTTNSILSFDGQKYELKYYPIQIDPIYLPVYIAVLDCAKSQFINTIKKYKSDIVYANTDGFISKKLINMEELNSENSNQHIGNYRVKNIYKDAYIECINGYAATVSDGTLDNKISGVKLTETITPDEYINKDFEYYINEITPSGTLRRTTVKPLTLRK